MIKIQQFLKLLLPSVILRDLWSLLKAAITPWRVYYREKTVPQETLADGREAASAPSFAFFFLMISSSVIATLGLLSNSSAVIIGAMIVAPLMNPILSMSFAIVTVDWTLHGRSMATVFLGASCAILVSYGISLLIPINVVGSEVIARTAPNLMDLGIAIAAGAAGSFSLTRLSIASSIAGVAIAVALVPPLCVVGIGLALGERLATDVSLSPGGIFRVSEGAFLLFLANLAGITFTACIVFLAQSYGSVQKSLRSILIWASILALLFSPLSRSLKEFLVSNLIRFQMVELRVENPKVWKSTQIRYIGVRLKEKTAYVTLLVNAPKGILSDKILEKAEQRVFDAISGWGVEAMDFTVRISPVLVREYTSHTKHIDDGMDIYDVEVLDQQ
jgi:uncharacterized hydrophobic protein (TIGR00271 family)